MHYMKKLNMNATELFMILYLNVFISEQKTTNDGAPCCVKRKRSPETARGNGNHRPDGSVVYK